MGGPSEGHSRNLLKGMLARTNVADLKSFKVYVDGLISQIPGNGSTINLQPLFGKLALDAPIEMLVGQSVGSLISNTTLDAKAFLSSTVYAQAGVEKRM